MDSKSIAWALLTLVLVAHSGCSEVVKKMQLTWHQKCGWNAEDYFDDPQVIALCHAIEANDIAEIDRLFAAGANVNAQGKGKMTTLLWAFPDNKLDRFKRLLEHGADPNVIVESDFNTRGSGIRPGDSVTHMASKTGFQGYFKAVFEHGGDVNLVNSGKANLQNTPLFYVIELGGADKKQKINLLIDKGADINYMNGAWATPSMQAVTWGGQYDIALMLLKAGADHRVYVPKSNSRLIHIVLAEDRRKSTWTPQQQADYQKLIEWLKDHGESIEEALADRERWKSWSQSTGEYRRKMDAEIASRKAREAREKAAEKKANPNDE